jgi:ABC-type nickel/cobalt efflux system permease component RcnA
VALAGVVTFTHTISVFALGLGTLAASRAIPLSRVVPGLSLLSSLTVTAIGGFMLWKAVWHERTKGRNDGQHAHVADQEHAAHHLREALAVRGERRVTMRSLVALGVTGGIVPCPDALAILLLAIGANQVGFGLLALVAFSLGLAGVLVAVGMAVAISGRAWLRVRQTVADSRGYLPGMQSLAWQRLLALSPVVRAAVVLVLGFLMLWRASASL